MARIFLLALLFLSSNGLFAQNDQQAPLFINFYPLLQAKPLVLDQEESVLVGDTLLIETLRFYISNLRFLKDGQTIWQEANSYHLIDAAEKESLQIECKLPQKIDFDTFQFNLGIDSLTNVAGVMGGDLDPTKGMYWSWNTGYINFKLEGRSKLSPARKNAFTFHLGGYLPPHQSIQTVQIKTSPKSELNININITKFLETIDLSKDYRMMSTGAAAKDLSRISATIFYCDEK